MTRALHRCAAPSLPVTMSKARLFSMYFCLDVNRREMALSQMLHRLNASLRAGF